MEITEAAYPQTLLPVQAAESIDFPKILQYTSSVHRRAICS